MILGARLTVVLKPGAGLAPPSAGRHLLPYRIHNDSSLLIGFRQPGCPQWDLLGTSEVIIRY